MSSPIGSVVGRVVDRDWVLGRLVVEVVAESTVLVGSRVALGVVRLKVGVFPEVVRSALCGGISMNTVFLVRVPEASHIVVMVAGEVAEGIVDVDEVELADCGACSVELGGDDFVVVDCYCVFEAGAVVPVFGEPFGVSLHDVFKDSEGFVCCSVFCFHVAVGVVVINI